MRTEGSLREDVLRVDDKLERSRKTSWLYGSDIRLSWLLLSGYKAIVVVGSPTLPSLIT